MILRSLCLAVAVVLLAACDDKPETAAMPAPTNPASLAGRYELWLCPSAECGPATSAPGVRVGRIDLGTEVAPPIATDSSSAFYGCAHIGLVAKLDSGSAPVTVRWKAGEVPGRIIFGLVQDARAEYEVTLDDLGGLLKGEARWRRDGIISEEAPEVVVARKSPEKPTLACAPPRIEAPAASPAMKAPKAAKKGA